MANPNKQTSDISVHYFGPTSCLTLVGHFLQTFETAPLSLRNIRHLQACGMINLRTSITTDHFAKITTNLATIFVGG